MQYDSTARISYLYFPTTLCSVSHCSFSRVLQEENADLQQNLLQTVVCIESLEAELQRTRDELSHVKEKYKRSEMQHSMCIGFRMYTSRLSIAICKAYGIPSSL